MSLDSTMHVLEAVGVLLGAILTGLVVVGGARLVSRRAELARERWQANHPADGVFEWEREAPGSSLPVVENPPPAMPVAPPPPPQPTLSTPVEAAPSPPASVSTGPAHPTPARPDLAASIRRVGNDGIGHVRRFGAWLRGQPGPRKLVAVLATAGVVWAVGQVITTPTREWGTRTLPVRGCGPALFKVFDERCGTYAVHHLMGLGAKSVGAAVVLGVAWLLTAPPSSSNS